MKNRIGFTLLFLLGFVLGLALMAQDARAQQPTPGGTSAKPQTKETAGPYEVKSSIEVGVRGISIEGNATKYRSDLNYEPGFKVFDASLLIDSKDNNGVLFDKLMVNSFGWGNDPSRFLRVNVEKNKWYRFDANYRRVNYFNNLNNIALQQHTQNTEYRQGDFDAVLLPQNRNFRVNLGYSLSRNSGPSVFTYDYQRDEFPVLAPTRYQSNEYRVGFDARLSIFDISFLQGWRYFKDDTEYIVNSKNVGNNPTNTSVINTFHRDLPTRGETPFSRLSVHSLIAKKVDFTGRYIYTKGETNFNLFETVTGIDSSGNNIVLDKYNSTGKVTRPNSQGDLGVTLFLTDKLRISNTFGFNNFHINGASILASDLERTRNTAFGTSPLPPVIVSTLYGRTTEFKRFQNQIEIDYDFHPQFSAHFGHRYTDRHIEQFGFDQASTVTTAPLPETETFDNRTNTYIFGFKARPVRPWSVYLDIDTGESDNVFTRVANYQYTNFRVRSILRPTKTLALNTSLITKDNSNPSILATQTDDYRVNINSRVFTTSVDWLPATRFNISGGYTRMHVTSDVGVIFFLSGVKKVGTSEFFVRDNFAFVSTFVELHPRVRFYGAYRIHKDDGQGDRVSKSPDVIIGSYPVQYQSPEVRVSVKLHDRVDWVAGYQYFDFKERFLNQQFYQAHLPYTSLKFYFGGRE